METIRVISSTIIKPQNHKKDESPVRIDLTPWDLPLISVEHITRGLLFHKEKHTAKQIQHLQHSLSSALTFFPPLAGRLAILRHDDNIVTSHIVCNNAGALFVHAVAPNTTLADIVEPKYVPPIVYSLFHLKDARNYEGTSQPLMAVQVTELLDGIFIGLTMNHVVADGNSFWHFVNSWAEISRGSSQISKLPSFQRCFLDGVDPPIQFPFPREQENFKPQTPPMRIFSFSKQRITQLKSKANLEANMDKISSLQALLTHLWRSVIRCQHIEELEQEVCFVIMIGIRPRMDPPLAEGYFGNAALPGVVTMKAGELLEACGLGKGAWEMNKMISSYSLEKIKKKYEWWVKTPKLLGAVVDNNSLITSSSPRFNMYGNDFGWGKPIALRSGGPNVNRMLTLFSGAEEGSMDVELHLPFEILEAMGNDSELIEN